jgi:hypothetical protein
MKEDFLHYIWKFQNFNTVELVGTKGEQITVKSIGVHNQDAGPDFLNARVIINDREWAGNVEIHIKSSDWFAHKHEVDTNYESVILHVVHEYDQPVKLKDGTEIPTLELKSIIPKTAIDNYTSLLRETDWLACRNSIADIDSFTLKNWIDRLLFERLEAKLKPINDILKQFNGDWESVFYIWLAKYFGFKVNSDPFFQLAINIPFQLYSKYDQSMQIEALLFGQAGLLSKEFNDDYPTLLKKEYTYLKAKHNLFEMDGSNWKFLRLRPANFPTIRLSQFASLVFQHKKMFSLILGAKSISDLIQLLDAKSNEYWESHFLFDKASKPNRFTQLGISGKRILIINAIVPVLFAYGRETGNEELVNRAVQFLEQLESEKNTIVTHFEKNGVKVNNAYSSQALIQLSTLYCKNKNCLNCAIGNKIIRS